MLDDLANRLALLARVWRAEADIDAGRGVSLEQMRRQFDERLAELRAEAATCATA